MHPDHDDCDIPLVHPYRQSINQLKARRGLDPRDPEALDEEEEALLAALEDWEP